MFVYSIGYRSVELYRCAIFHSIISYQETPTSQRHTSLECAVSTLFGAIDVVLYVLLFSLSIVELAKTFP